MMSIFPRDVDDLDPDIGYLDKPVDAIEPDLEPSESSTEIKPEDIKPEDKTEPLSAKEEFEEKLEMIKLIISAVTGGVSISSRINPVLMPENWKTTSILTRGEIAMINSFTIFAQQSPEECICMLDYCIGYASLKLSESGFGIEKAIELGKALTQTGEGTKLIASPEKPQEGSKKKE